MLLYSALATKEASTSISEVEGDVAWRSCALALARGTCGATSWHAPSRPGWSALTGGATRPASALCTEQLQRPSAERLTDGVKTKFGPTAQSQHGRLFPRTRAAFQSLAPT